MNGARLTVLIILLAAGVFPRYAHAVVDYAAWAVQSVLVIASTAGLHIDSGAVEAVIVLALVIVVIASLSSVIMQSNKWKRKL